MRLRGRTFTRLTLTAFQLSLLLSALAWIAYRAHERIGTPPEAPHLLFAESLKQLEPVLTDDASEHMNEALASFPALPMFIEPPPAGTRWVFEYGGGSAPIDVMDVNDGPWDLETRPHLRAAVKYLTDPETESALEQLRLLRDRDWRWSRLYTDGDSVPGVDFSAFRQATKTRVARARYRHAALNDVQGAWDDLKTVLLQGERVPRLLFIDGLVLASTQSIVFEELMQMSRERYIEESVGRDMDQTLARLSSLAGSWGEMMTHEAPFHRALCAALFTDDGQGNGWLVLSEWDSLSSRFVFPGTGRPPLRDRSQFWNLFSGLFNDRTTVESKANSYRRRMVELTTRPYPEALAAVEQFELEGPVFHMMDGPQLAALDSEFSPEQAFHSYRLMLKTQAQRDATRIMVALSRHHAVHRQYPQGLEQLVPDFIGDLPADPFCGGPFGYRLQGAEGFSLYSCGNDGRDDDSVSRADLIDRAQDALAGWDIVYTEARSESMMDITAEPLVPSTVSEGAEESPQTGNDGPP